MHQSSSFTAPGSPLSTAAASLSNYSVVNATEVTSLYYPCPSLDSSTYETQYQDTFILRCGIDYFGGQPATGGGVISDIASLIAYTPQDCFDACSSLNAYSAKWNSSLRCKAATWALDLANETTEWGGNCFLKNATLADNVTPATNELR